MPVSRARVAPRRVWGAIRPREGYVDRSGTRTDRLRQTPQTRRSRPKRCNHPGLSLMPGPGSCLRRRYVQRWMAEASGEPTLGQMRDPYELFDSEIERGPRSGWAFVTGAVIGGLIVVAALLVFGDLGNGGDGGGGGRPAAAAVPSGTTDPKGDPTPTASTAESLAPMVDQCMERYEAQGEPLEAADSALAQWRVHVGAMNQLVTGTITLRQATAFWNRTRVDAEERLAVYDAAARSLDGLARCQKGDTEVAHCRAAVHARSRQLALADRSLATWREHVHHMEMLRHGHITPKKATRMWLASWQQGVRQLDAYDASARDAGRHHC